ncbi:hypothetical protein CHS0354_039792 [Potamilus streckersoni]|uniref:non-specific serine/threonine protein kinase n=1 Tax=Potamilus streckersoni TaxID=2493646 RepID=A0AAE0VN23_9BIVA|nr:hypothetical protein CHS0354_039792 [Potamilus streckersoni]
MDTRSLKLYKEALQDGKEKVHNIRVIVVGPPGVGKTTLIKRLFGDVNVIERTSTEGMDVHTGFCKVSFATKEWKTQEKDAYQHFRLQRVQKILNKHIQKQAALHKQEVWSMMSKSAKAEQDNEQEDKPKSSQPVDLSSVKLNMDDVENVEQSETGDVPLSQAESDTCEKKMDTLMELYQLVTKNADRLESMEEYVPLSVLDFVGDHAFYTTHQMLMTSHAVYLLVVDLNQLVSELIKGGEGYLDIEGVELSKIHNLIGVWLNSIHSCTPSPLSGIPPVILVGTHADMITQESQQKVIDKCFIKLRYILRDKPTIRHLLDEFALDNTKLDPKLDQLKNRIFELASQQPHWGEEKPARWIPLEQAIMSLKASGVKVVPLTCVEEINRSGSVRIESIDELDQFLRFQHDLGTIFYFSVEELRKKIVLDPQWLIDAMKFLTMAEMFILRSYPDIKSKIHEFKDKGILTPEVIDAVWAKDVNPEFHDNKEHILLLMERLNLIVKPRVYNEDTMKPKVEKYFFVPCMLRKAAPEKVFYPMPPAEKCSSSVLSFLFMDKFMPVTIFHHLLAACVAKWTIITTETESLIYYDCVVLDLDNHHRLILFCKENAIFARVTRLGMKRKTPSFKLCHEVREFITTNLQKVMEYLRESLKFSLFIQCPKSEPDSVDCVLSVKILKKYMDVPCHFHDRSHLVLSFNVLKFWFPNELFQGKTFRIQMMRLQNMGRKKFLRKMLFLQAKVRKKTQIFLPNISLFQRKKFLRQMLYLQTMGRKNILRKMVFLQSISRKKIQWQMLLPQNMGHCKF